MTRPRSDLGRPGGYGVVNNAVSGLSPWENFLVRIEGSSGDGTFQARARSNAYTYYAERVEADLTGDPSGVGATVNSLGRIVVPAGATTFNLPSDLQYWAWSLCPGGNLGMDFFDEDSIHLNVIMHEPFFSAGSADGSLAMVGISDGPPGVGMVGYFTGMSVNGSDWGMIESADDAAWSENTVATEINRLAFDIVNPQFISHTTDQAAYGVSWWGDDPRTILGKSNALTLAHFADPYIVFGVGRRTLTAGNKVFTPTIDIAMVRTYG